VAARSAPCSVYVFSIFFNDKHDLWKAHLWASRLPGKGGEKGRRAIGNQLGGGRTTQNSCRCDNQQAPPLETSTVLAGPSPTILQLGRREVLNTPPYRARVVPQLGKVPMNSEKARHQSKDKAPLPVTRARSNATKKAYFLSVFLSVTRPKIENFFCAPKIGGRIPLTRYDTLARNFLAPL